MLVAGHAKDITELKVSVAAFEKGEETRNERLAEGLDKLESLKKELKGHMLTGDLESRVEAAAAFVTATEVGAALAKLRRADPSRQGSRARSVGSDRRPRDT